MRRLLLTVAFVVAALIASGGVADARPCPETGLPRPAGFGPLVNGPTCKQVPDVVFTQEQIDRAFDHIITRLNRAHVTSGALSGASCHFRALELDVHWPRLFRARSPQRFLHVPMPVQVFDA